MKEQRAMKSKRENEDKKSEPWLSKLDTSKELKNTSSLKRISVNEIKEDAQKESKWISPTLWLNEEIKEEIESSGKDEED